MSADPYFLKLIEPHYRQLVEMGEKRSAKLYAWLRWLVLLASGAFSLMLGLLVGKQYAPEQWLALKAALLLNAAGILFGAAALYGEIDAARQMVKKRAEAVARSIEASNLSAANAPTTYAAHIWLRQAEPACYVALLGAVAAYAAFVLLL